MKDDDAFDDWGKVRVSGYGTLYIPSMELVFSREEILALINEAKQEAVDR